MLTFVYNMNDDNDSDDEIMTGIVAQLRLLAVLIKMETSATCGLFQHLQRRQHIVRTRHAWFSFTVRDNKRRNTSYQYNVS